MQKAGFTGDEDKVLAELEQMLDKIMHLRTMTEVGMTAEDIAPFTKNIVDTKQRLLTKALCPVDAEMIASMYQERL